MYGGKNGMNKYTVMQILSSWNEEEKEWVEEDKVFLGEVYLPKKDPIESQCFANFMEPYETPMKIYTELNDWGHRTINVATDDGQEALLLVCQEGE